MKGKAVPFAFSLGVLALDQILKGLVVARLSLGQSIPLIPGFLYLSRVHNTGSAFGLMGGRNYFLASIAALIALGMGWGLWRGIFPGRWGKVGGSLVLGGALGNLLDRVLRGYVVDYVDFRFFPAFNLADAAVVVGAAAMAAAFLWEKE